jgi:hypothetical protein
MKNDSRPFLLLALLSAFPPLSTDMYLPAIPLLLIFIFFMLGAFSMWLIALDWADKIRPFLTPEGGQVRGHVGVVFMNRST